jgi:hypothetical protein
MAGVKDRRGEFRQLFCFQEEQPLNAEDACRAALREFRGEPQSDAKTLAQPDLRGDYRLVVVTGMAWDCFRDVIDADELPTTRLKEYGFDTQLIEVEGLSSSDSNAAFIAETLLSDANDSRPLLLFGYSKGAADLMVALQRYEALRAQTAALVTVAGAVGGSPMAEHTSSATISALQHSPYGDCSNSDGTALESLRPSVRHSWMADFLPLGIPTYSLITAPEPERVSRALRSSYQLLGAVHPLNDGALLHWDQLLPKGNLLGYANADHWAVAIPLEVEDIPLGDFLLSNGYPRTRLWLSLADFVIADLNRAPKPTQAPTP